MAVIDKDTTFLGFRRENGRVGVRNHVIILPLDDLSNAGRTMTWLRTPTRPFSRL